MSMKWIAAAGAVVLLAGGAWYLRGGKASEQGQEVGGKGVVVPLEVAAARETPKPLVDATKLEDAAQAPRAAVGSVPSPARTSDKPRIQGFLFVDDEHRVPADLALSVEKSRAKLVFDAGSASYSLDELGGEPARLWITSGSTVPALIPIPSELCAKGGVFDLHLSTGRTLTLTFLDKETKQPLPNLEFALNNQIETARGNGRLSTRGEDFLHRTDAQGKALLTGIPLAGAISVTVDSSKRERDMVMQDGKTMHVRMPREPDWETWLKQEQPAHLEQTIFVSLPLGEACASGQVPPWAVKLAGGLDSVRVIARETTNESPQARGMPFLLEQDEHGGFEVCVEAPSAHAVWLERTQSRERISGETVLDVTRPGAQDPITFRELDGRKVTLHFVHVPERGQLQFWTVGKDRSNAIVGTTCQGADFTREFTLTGDERIQISLRLGSDVHDKSGWTRLLKFDTEHEITVDLGGCERTVRLECPECGTLADDGSIALMRCEGGQVSLEQTIVVLCSAGRGVSAVHIPNGRWLYRYDDKDQPAIWGVVDVKTATEPGEELVLRPRIRLAPAEEFGASVRFDEIEGISLAKLPEKFRTLSVKAPGERIAVPVDAKYATLDEKK
jgi:hypothetical protein